MERCKHCGEVVDRTDFIYCPACGKLLSDNSVDKKELKKQAETKQTETKNVVKQESSVGVVAGKTNDKVVVKGGKVRKSYIVFGVFAFIIGVLLVLTSGYWGAKSYLFGNAFADKMCDISEKIVGNVIKDSSTTLKMLPGTLRGLIFFFLCAVLLSIISIITFFSLFTKRTTVGHVFVKIGSLICMNFLILYFFVQLCACVFIASTENAEFLNAQQLQTIIDFLNESSKLLKNLSLYCMVSGGAFLLLGIILSITKFGNPYNTTFYQYFRAFFFLACSVLYYFIIVKNFENKILSKLLEFLLNGFPYYLVITSLCMFFSAKMKKSK